MNKLEGKSAVITGGAYNGFIVFVVLEDTNMYAASIL
jgi:hypothetical protein